MKVYSLESGLFLGIILEQIYIDSQLEYVVQGLRGKFFIKVNPQKYFLKA